MKSFSRLALIVATALTTQACITHEVYTLKAEQAEASKDARARNPAYRVNHSRVTTCIGMPLGANIQYDLICAANEAGDLNCK